jgi:hypothetical protein
MKPNIEIKSKIGLFEIKEFRLESKSLALDI